LISIFKLMLYSGIEWYGKSKRKLFEEVAMFGELVYRIGKLYSKARELNPELEFPYLSGRISELVSEDVMYQLPELQGEYIIAYNDTKGNKAMIRVYFEDGNYEAEGTNDAPNIGFSLSSHAS
jgi:hypothetical protein